MRTIHTERLILREFKNGDSKFILELLNTEGWLRYIGNRNVNDEQQAVNFIEGRLRPSYIEHGFGFFLVQLKQNEIPIGMCGLVKREGLDNIDIGYAFLPQYFGHGYAYESCQAIMEFAKNDLKLGALDSITMSINEPSIKLLEKLGFHFERNLILNEEELMLFRKAI